MSEPIKKIINSILEITIHDEVDRTRMEMRYNSKNVLNPEMKGVVMELAAQNVAYGINRLPDGVERPLSQDEIGKLVTTARIKTKLDTAKIVAKALSELFDDLYSDMDGFVSPAVDRAYDILANDVGTLDESDKEKTEPAPAAEEQKGGE